VSERKPGLVAHDLQDDFFAVRQLDETTGSGARLGDDGRHRALDLLGRHDDRVLPALVRLRRRLVAWEQLGESLVRGRGDGFAGVGRPHAVAPLDLVGVRKGLARQRAGVGAQADQWSRSPPSSISSSSSSAAETSQRGSTGGSASTAAASSGGP
jgi:hypothetical protein